MSAAAAAKAVSGALGTVTPILGGLQRSAAAKSDALAQEYKARALATRAAAQSAEHRESLNDTLSSIEVIRQGRNIGVGGSTELAISREQRNRSRDNENSEVLSTRYEIVNANTRAASSRRAATASLVQGVIGGIGGLAKATA